jgi:lipopolysaccharide export system protein LptA
LYGALKAKFMKFRVFLTFFIPFIAASLFAQEGELINYEAESLKGGQKDGENIIKLIGKVKFSQTSTNIFCDSAYLYRQRNSLEAYGHVRVEDFEDSVYITANTLFYNGDNRMAELRNNVVYTDDSIQLYTDNLDYDMTNKSASYFGGGKIVDGINSLDSEEGLYDTEAKLMIFQQEVVLSNPDYRLESGELIYNIITKHARTTDYTEITTNNGRKLFAQQGSEFDTSKKTSAFLSGEIDTESYYIKAGELFYDQLNRYYSASVDVYVYGKSDNIIITGDHARFYEDTGVAEVFGNPVLKKPMLEDTLFLSADTLVSIDSKNADEKRLLAYNNVMVYKWDIQGKADSMAYFIQDSLIFLYTNPVLWNAGSQISADSINLVVSKGTIERMNTSVNSFIISLDSVDNFNQIKGRKMTAWFKGSNIETVDVNGNGESIYFALDEENNNQLVGMNYILCSDMKIRFKDNQLNSIKFYPNSDASFSPPHEIKESERTLKDFDWRIDERPLKEDVIQHTRFTEEEKPAVQPDAPPTDELLPVTLDESEERRLRNKLKTAKERDRIENAEASGNN